jgi:NitT/TauT family transport system ATP-binding protein
MTLLHADRIAYSFGDTPIFADVSLTLPEGAFVALVGPSGVGKSTLLRLLMGTLQPTAGSVTMHGVPSHETAEPIGVVFQRDNLMPWRTAYDNVRLPLQLKGENGRSAEQRVMAMLELVGLSGYEQHYPAQLSGGMAQRVAIARALVHQPALLLLDEPFGALDALTRERMGQELLRIWQAMPITVFMVTHSIGEAVLLADEVLVMGTAVDTPETPATLTHRLPITLPRPRRLEMQFNDQFLDYVRRIRDALG